jgi:hypothetical protein
LTKVDAWVIIFLGIESPSAAIEALPPGQGTAIGIRLPATSEFFATLGKGETE